MTVEPLDQIKVIPLPEPITRIIVLLMVKNESRIIGRCIRSAMSVADAICVCDTGSTDNTVEEVETLKGSLEKDIPIRIYNHSWKNFGYNRSLSFQSAVDMATSLSYPLLNTYALLLDADMILCNVKLDKNSLTKSGYSLIQVAGTMEYYNVRLVNLGNNWRCIGATHEYWEDVGGPYPDKLPKDIIYIDDWNDGGCKSDKFERDKRLLTEEFEENPKNERTTFYLARTYECLGDIDNSIKYYKLRAEMGGFYEEVFYSMYCICKQYIAKGDLIEAEYWCQKAYERFPTRAEALHKLVVVLREKSIHTKAYHYIQLGKRISLPTSDMLFIETDVYNHGFLYEESIIAYYMDKHREGLNASLEYLKRVDAPNSKFSGNIGNVLNNMQFYLKDFKKTFANIPVEKGDLHSPNDGDFHSTSTSLIEYRGDILANIRYVNYDIVNGSYIMTENGEKSASFPVRTINKMARLSPTIQVQTLDAMNLSGDLSIYPHFIRGMEDVRLFCFDGETIHYLASSKDVSPEGNIVIVKGIYDPESKTMHSNRIIESPKSSGCEKNWIMFDDSLIIYQWSPFTVGKLNEKDGKLKLLGELPVAGILRQVRGSTNFVRTGKNTYVGIVHGVYATTPRKYYHLFVELTHIKEKTREGLSISRYSVPFFFDSLQIEYCIGLLKTGGSCYIVYSRNDSNPAFICFDSHHLDKVFSGGFSV